MTNGIELGSQEETLALLRALLKDGQSMPTLAEIERVAITTAIDRFGVKECGRVLDIGKTTVYRKMLEYRIPSPPTRRHVAAVPFESLGPLLESAWRAADYLQRCIGTAKRIGGDLDRELRRFGAKQATNGALGASTNGDSQNR
jgi:hypothetical protein